MKFFLNAVSFSAHPFTIPPYPNWPLLRSFGTDADWFKNPYGPVLLHSSVRVNVWCKQYMQCTKEDLLFDFSCSKCSGVQLSAEHLNMHICQNLLA